MHWTRNSDSEAKTVTYTAFGGYNYRKGLAKLGFEFVGRERVWRITFSQDDKERMEAIEGFLKATEKFDMAEGRLKANQRASQGYW